jgi:hypothetical protein
MDRTNINTYFFVNKKIISLLINNNSLLLNTNLDGITPLHTLIKINNNNLIKYICNNHINLNMLIIEPNQFDPVTFEDIEDGDRVVLINNDKRFMFKENVFNMIYNNKKMNPFTNEPINYINRYVVIILP